MFVVILIMQVHYFFEVRSSAQIIYQIITIYL